MAKFGDIIDEFKTVSDAFDAVNYFIYDRVSRINGPLKDKAYPMILVSAVPDTERGDNNNSYLPRGKRFTFNIFCFADYNTAEKSAKTLQTKQGEVDNLLDQYIAELISRNIDGSNGFSILLDSIGGFIAHDVHNDKLVQSTYRMVVELDSDCVTGTFNY